MRTSTSLPSSSLPLSPALPPTLRSPASGQRFSAHQWVPVRVLISDEEWFALLGPMPGLAPTPGPDDASLRA
jgi:hypothetical protein